MTYQSKSTPAMRARAKELATPPRDDFDRAVLAVLADFDNAQAIERERCASLYDNVNSASDDERHNNVPGAGAMGAIIEFRDLIRSSQGDDNA